MPRKPAEPESPERFLPLHKDTFQILVALAAHDRHGYSILQDISARTEGRHNISPSTLYTAVRRMMETGFIEELDERPDPEFDDQRRRYYRITDFGRSVAIAEARRLERLLSDARASGLVPKRL
jgi:DNA-binding PadR family transcriptional regulator